MVSRQQPHMVNCVEKSMDKTRNDEDIIEV